MSKTNITITLSDEEMSKLEDIVAFIQTKSIATVTRTDVLKWFIIKNHELLNKFKSGKNQEETYKHFEAMGLDLTFRVD